MTGSTKSTHLETPLEDVMAAMDVVDTLRHQQTLVDRELDDDARRDRLLHKLRDLYAAQGLDVPDRVLQEGIDALEQERFQYQAPKPSFSIKLAHWYVARRRWGKFVAMLLFAGLLFGGIHLFNDVLPEQRIRQALPTQVQSVVDEIQVVARNLEVSQQAQQQAASAQAALNNDKLDTAQSIHNELEQVLVQLSQRYVIKVISRPNQSSGVWRVPDVNQSSKNYYLIVEAVDAKNNVVTLPIVSEETGSRKRVDKWGIRVNETTFYAVAADKNDDGIIQNNVVGEKKVGYLEPQFKIATTGATITQW